MNTTQVINGKMWSLTITQDMLPITSDYPMTDDNWRYTDLAGHEHRGDALSATTTTVVDEKHWCDGNEGWTHHDPHMHVDRSHLECAECGEHITPGMLPLGSTKYLSGQSDTMFRGMKFQGPVTTKFLAWVTEEEIEFIKANGQDDNAMIKFMDSIPQDHYLEWTHES